LLLAICLISGVLGAIGFELWRAAKEPRWVPLRLDAKAADRGLLVTWDSAAATGDRAVLTIDDGGARHEINLTQQQIRTGSFQYVPAHTDVAFRLILYSDGVGVSGDAVRIASMAGRTQPSAPEPPPASAPASPPSRAASRSP
jgi:hypothetical protein